VDRCTTCHIASDDPRFERYAQPLRAHPYSAATGDTFKDGKWERRHKFSDFGCTVCHDGQGRGLEPEYSHGKDPFWPDPMLGHVTQAGWRKDYVSKLKGKEYIEANCAQCHTEENSTAIATVEKGRKLFFSNNCYGCHRIEGLSDGTLGPDLTEVGRKFKLDYLWESIDDPRANTATSFMPKFRLSDDEIRALVVFLKSRKGMNFAETEIQRYRAKFTGGAEVTPAVAKFPQAKSGTPAAGEKLIADRACAACHKLGAKDGGIAPDLSFEGLLKSDEWIFTHFKNPRSTVPDSIMPTFRFTDDEFHSMTSHLATLKTAPKMNGGQEIYKALCERCHGEKGDGHGMIAIYLDPYPRDLTKAGFINSKSMDRLMNSVRNGVGGTSMPAWAKVLDEAQAKVVLGYVFANFTREPRKEVKPLNAPDKNPVAQSEESAGRGEALFVKRCAGCHGRKADGKGPNSLDILPRPRNLRNAAFVESVSDRRLFESILYGVQGTAMPSWVDYGLTQDQVGDVINFIRNINRKAERNQYARAD
jgi:sulfur oxidation c-type cytochrome SoxX